MNRLVVASYNVHGGVGLDRRFNPQRIAAVLAEIDADLVALQEVSSRQPGLDLGAFLGASGGYQLIEGVTFQSPHGPFGNALLTRLPLLEVQRIDLSVARREPRGAIDATLEWAGQPLRVIATHFGLKQGERFFQARRIVELAGNATQPTLLLGDINEWVPRASSLRCLRQEFGREREVLTFPAPMPALALDRLWVHPPTWLHEMRAHASPLARVASDHLPLVAELRAETSQLGLHER
jgi:endonuclease/exonuclease/phosphatase family metal-dependent hydrolase